MPTIRTTLLYTDRALPDLDAISTALNARLHRRGVRLQDDGDPDPHHAIFSSPDWQISVTATTAPLPAETFHGAMDSILSQTVIGVLGPILLDHRAHLQIDVVSVRQTATPTTWLDAQRLAHAAATVVAEAGAPAAIHWQPSHQLLTGQQYAQMASEQTPWPLFANTTIARSADATKTSLRIDNAADFIGRPILFPDTDLSLDLAYAAALSFLRHAVETGAPIPDGHSFGPEDGYVVRVTHATATAALPQGSFVLRNVSSPRKQTGSRAGAMPLPTAVRLSREVVLDQTRERTRSLAISFLMLVLLPPVGLVLLFSNGLLRPSSGRTGFVAMTALAIVMVIGAYTFLNVVAEDTATLNRTAAIEVQSLAD